MDRDIRYINIQYYTVPNRRKLSYTKYMYKYPKYLNKNKTKKCNKITAVTAQFLCKSYSYRSAIWRDS